MSTPFPEHTGIREQHLLRKKDNPLFEDSERDVSNEALAKARMEDGVEMDAFMSEFQTLVQRAAALEANTPSETILEIKEQLDRSYQQCCALPGDQATVKAAIRKLIETIMRAVESGIGNDAYAQRKLKRKCWPANCTSSCRKCRWSRPSRRKTRRLQKKSWSLPCSANRPKHSRPPCNCSMNHRWPLSLTRPAHLCNARTLNESSWTHGYVCS